MIKFLLKSIGVDIGVGLDIGTDGTDCEDDGDVGMFLCVSSS